MWTSAKSDFDYSLNFPQWWERDIEAMVAKDVNHPSVILYSIGNEIPETGSPAGAAWGRKLAEKVRALDGTRYVTNAVNGMLAVLDDLAAHARAAERGRRHQHPDGRPRRHDERDQLLRPGRPGGPPSRSACSTSPASTTPRPATPWTGTCSRTGSSSAARPSPPASTATGGWSSSTRNVIGDFTWTGWDYLGEAGIGRPQYATRGRHAARLHGAVPVAAGGLRRHRHHRAPPAGLLLPGDRLRPARPSPTWRSGGRSTTARPSPGRPWAWSDSVASWTWPGSEGAPVTVEVYSDADEVELLVNGRSLGRKPAGESHRFRAEFEAVYAAGRTARRRLHRRRGNRPPRPAVRRRPGAAPAPRPTGRSSPRTAATSPTSPSPSPTRPAPAAPGPTGRCGSRSPGRASCSASAAPAPRPRSDSTRPSAAPTTDGPSPSSAPPARARSA